MAWVSILRGASGRHYIVSTLDLEQRRTLSEARRTERTLKAKKNPKLAIFHLQQP